jgi:hypothetical protein
VSLNDTVEAIAAALQPLTGEIPELQIYPYYNSNPTPPSIDVYPGDPFQQATGFGVGNSRVWFTVRARVSIADPVAGNQLLLRLLDPNDTVSVEAALAEAETAVIDAIEGSVSGFRRYADDAGDGLLGCEWRAGVFLK